MDLDEAGDVIGKSETDFDGMINVRVVLCAVGGSDRISPGIGISNASFDSLQVGRTTQAPLGDVRVGSR